ncbi:MAG: LysE family transporter [Cyclobacteriaceae bacterium]|nr:LysE family transporter [Cyclobacteriaceae bacterium]MCX7636929.1 LysE family transporter [Cyclobacteriaceae bacterium]MDW8330374.1 LysE family transporter [Cyclobacteriaceae bacterium]
MMDAISVFILAFVFSFVGSIPPGTINLTAVQLGLEHRMSVAWRFALAAALVEYPYAWIAIQFEQWITASTAVRNNLMLIGGLIMLLIGGLNIYTAGRTTGFAERIHNSGFRRGLIYSLLNPLLIPYWIAVTAYLRGHGWVAFNSNLNLHAYLMGLTIGAFSLFILASLMARRMVKAYQPHSRIRMIPGIILIGLGIYSLVRFWWQIQ